MQGDRTVMCLCRVTGHSGHVDRTLRSVYPKLQCLQCDQTLASVRSALTGHVRSLFSLSRTLLESTGRCLSASSHLTSLRLIASNIFTLVK